MRIKAVVTTNEKHLPGGVPIFVVESNEELQRQGFLIEQLLDSSAHQIAKDTIILVGG